MSKSSTTSSVLIMADIRIGSIPERFAQLYTQTNSTNPVTKVSTSNQLIQYNSSVAHVGTQLIWYMTDKFNSSDSSKYSPNELKLCEMDPDGICRYRNDKRDIVYLADAIIVDKDVMQTHRDIFQLMKYFESSENVLVLVTNEPLPLVNDKNITAAVYHLIDYNCELLDSETGSTKLLLAAYLIVLALWLYRNVVHYPNTMTVLHRLLTIPPVLKVMLMATNYIMF